MRWLEITNRLLLAGVALSALAGGIAPLLVSTEPPEPSAPITVPDTDVLEVSPVALIAPDRNPFDPTGGHWQREAKPPKISQQPTALNAQIPALFGFLRIGSVEGVIGKEGFVAVGEDLSGVRIDDVGNWRVLLSTSDGAKEVLLDRARKERRRALFGEPGGKAQ